MKKIILIFGTLLFGVFALAQQMQPSAISNGGGNINISSVKAGFTIGEPVSGSISNGSVSFTQGFQQNYLVATDAINEWGKPQLTVSVSPNPSAKIFNVKIKNNQEPVFWQLLNIHGSLIQNGKGQGNEFIIDLSSHPKGIYYLKITQGQMQTIKKLVVQ